MADFFAHESSYVDDGCQIGAGTKIWHFSHVMAGSTIGKSCNIGQNVVISPGVVIGDNVKIQNNVSVYTGVILEDDVFCGPSMVFTNVVNPRSHVSRKDEYRETLVRRGASLGANCTVVCGHAIGRFAFIGAGAVVTKTCRTTPRVGNPGRSGWMCSAASLASGEPAWRRHARRAVAAAALTRAGSPACRFRIADAVCRTCSTRLAHAPGARHPRKPSCSARHAPGHCSVPHVAVLHPVVFLTYVHVMSCCGWLPDAGRLTTRCSCSPGWCRFLFVESVRRPCSIRQNLHLVKGVMPPVDDSDLRRDRGRRRPPVGVVLVIAQRPGAAFRADPAAPAGDGADDDGPVRRLIVAPPPPVPDATSSTSSRRSHVHHADRLRHRGGAERCLAEPSPTDRGARRC